MARHYRKRRPNYNLLDGYWFHVSYLANYVPTFSESTGHMFAHNEFKEEQCIDFKMYKEDKSGYLEIIYPREGVKISETMELKRVQWKKPFWMARCVGCNFFHAKYWLGLEGYYRCRKCAGISKMGFWKTGDCTREYVLMRLATATSPTKKLRAIRAYLEYLVRARYAICRQSPGSLRESRDWSW